MFLALDRDQRPDMRTTARVIYAGPDRWSFDDDDEFFAAYASGFVFAMYRVQDDGLPNDAFEVDGSNQLDAWGEALIINMKITVRSTTRGAIERVLAVFTDAVEGALVPLPPERSPPPAKPPTVFIGHGRSPLWRDLKDHLQDQHGYSVVAYETGARAGHAVRDILEQMLEGSSFAVLLMTGEDEQVDGSSRARQNVVHESGLFQGRLGFDRAIVAIEDGVEEFSNLQGVHQLRFSSGSVREIFGDVLATLRREFPAHAR